MKDIAGSSLALFPLSHILQFDAESSHRAVVTATEGTMVFDLEDACALRDAFENVANHQVTLEMALVSAAKSGSSTGSSSSAPKEHAVKTPFGMGMLQETESASRNDGFVVVQLEWGLHFCRSTWPRQFFQRGKSAVLPCRKRLTRRETVSVDVDVDVDKHQHSGSTTSTTRRTL